MIVKRVQNTGVVEATSTLLEIAKFSVAVEKNEAKEKIDLQVKLETILKACNSVKEEVRGKDSIIAKLQSQLTR